MDYFLKAGALMTIFYVCYVIFLQRETFFTSNRWFLILGQVTSVLYPMIVIPIYVEVPTNFSDGFTVISTSAQTAPEVFDLTAILIWMYAIGTSFFLGRLIIQLVSLLILINGNDKKKIGKYIHVVTTQKTTPFSFFRWIVYNQQQFSDQELELILRHEKVHAKQYHSIDVLFADLSTAFFWWNPFIWLYRKALKQNLEFIADHQTQKQSQCQKRYQKLLLKTSVPMHNLALINTFYNSTTRLTVFGRTIVIGKPFGQVKKRIVMLHKSKSKLMNSWKYSIIVPVLVIFAMTFNTQIIAQSTSDTVSEAAAQNEQNILKFVVTKDTKDKQLDFIKNKLAEKDATISFNNVKRNDKNEITDIKIKFEYKNTSGSNFVNSSGDGKPIDPIEISVNFDGNAISIGQQNSSLSQTFDVETTDDGINVLKNSSATKTIVIRSSDKDGNQEEIELKDGPTIINENGKRTYINKDKKHIIVRTDSEKTSDTGASDKIIFIEKDKNDKSIDSVFIERGANKASWTNNDGEDVEVIYIEESDKKVNVFSNAKNAPLVLVDGKEITKEEMEGIDPETIDSVTVLKDKSATKKYGKKGKNGVILIVTKK